MTSAIEKLADREQPILRRQIVCRRCSVPCSVPHDVALEDVACIGCLGRLRAPHGPDAPAGAVSSVADWWDKASAPGPGYGAVECPHCGATCVVEVGSAARTGCVVCLRPLGALPLIRVESRLPSARRRWDASLRSSREPRRTRRRRRRAVLDVPG